MIELVQRGESRGFTSRSEARVSGFQDVIRCLKIDKQPRLPTLGLPVGRCDAPRRGNIWSVGRISSHDGGKRGGYGRIAVPGQPGPRCRAGNAATAVGEASIVEGNQERNKEMPAREAEERMLRLRRQRPLPARQAEEQMHRLRRQRSSSSKMPTWEAEEQMQRLRRQRPLPAREAEERMLRLRRQRPLPAQQAEEQMQRLRRQRPLPAREAEERMLRLRRQRPLPAREAEEQMHPVSNLG